MSVVMINLTSRIAPSQAVAALDGLRFKSGERRLKRYVRGDRIAEAVHEGPLSVSTYEQRATIGEAMLVGRRRLTLADFPWSSQMDGEGIVMQHTTYITHRVSMICETGAAPEDSSVRIEWDFTATHRLREDDHAERVDWVLDKLGTKLEANAELTLKRLLRIWQKDAAEKRAQTQADDTQEKSGDHTAGPEPGDAPSDAPSNPPSGSRDYDPDSEPGYYSESDSDPDTGPDVNPDTSSEPGT